MRCRDDAATDALMIAAEEQVPAELQELVEAILLLVETIKEIPEDRIVEESEAQVPAEKDHEGLETDTLLCLRTLYRVTRTLVRMTTPVKQGVRILESVWC